MQTFLSKVTSQVLTNNNNIADITFILPSKRAGLFLKTELKKQVQKQTILPQIISIEEFIKHISGLELIDTTTSIFEFYKVYINNTPKDSTDTFDQFFKWASVLIQDFNEIDSNLKDAAEILNYVNDSKRIEQWNLESETELTSNYLSFFEQIKPYYSNFKKHLLQSNIGYQGLLYRKSCEQLDDYISNHKKTKFIFAGFNALNDAEEKIISTILQLCDAEIYWDNDTFYKNNIAGKYFKKYNENWSYYNKNTFNWQEENINSDKNIYLYGAPKNITQIKKVADILDQLRHQNKIQNTAVILGNEKQLPILLNSIPKQIKHVNVTMGYDLKNIPLTNLFDAVFQLHLNKNKEAFYYKNFITVIKHASLYQFWSSNLEFTQKLNKLIHQEKTLFITTKDVDNLLGKEHILTKLFGPIFMDWQDNPDIALRSFITTIDNIRASDSINNLDKEYLFKFHSVFLQLSYLNNKYGYIHNLKTLYTFYKQLLKTENLSFQGEPLKGLQVMGILESRVLDFENVIITSVNEGFLPATGSSNSFIPLDIKRERGLPTPKEKDSIFAYHFYRLLHRAKNIYILYNTETDDFGSGEQSRFITQLEIAKENGVLKNINVIKNTVIPKLIASPIELLEIEKTQSILSRLKDIAKNGYSPSSLGLYIRNPIAFYKRKVLQLKEFKEVEETIAANTFGTIIHDTLEAFYLPFINKHLLKEDITTMKSKLDTEVKKQFQNHYSEKGITSGKNYLTFEIAKQFVLNFLAYELRELNKGKKIKILGLEQDVSCQYQPSQLQFPITLKGQIDRIDEVDGTLRILDYKTGKVTSTNLKIKDWDLLITDDKYSKSFQVLLYAYIYGKVNKIDFNKTKMQSGIVSFKNLKEGFMPVNKGDIDQEIIQNLLSQLDILILELYDIETPFTEKEDPYKK